MFTMITAYFLQLKQTRPIWASPTQLACAKDEMSPSSLGGLFGLGGSLEERKLEVSPRFSIVAFKGECMWEEQETDVF